MIVQDELNAECGISQEDSGRQTSLRAGKFDSALEDEIEEERVVAVDFFQGISFVGSDVAMLDERARANQNVDRRQRVIAAVNQRLTEPSGR